MQKKLLKGRTCFSGAILCLFFLSQALNLKAQNTFQRSIKVGDSNQALSLYQMADSSFAMLAQCDFNNPPNDDLGGPTFMKLDKNASVSSLKTCNVGFSYVPGTFRRWGAGSMMHPSLDGGYIMAGSFNDYYYFGSGSGGYTGIDACIIKTDNAGNTKWSKHVGGSNDYDDFFDVQETTDSSYIAAGLTRSFGTGGNSIMDGVGGTSGGWGTPSNDVYLAKLDNKGALLWTKTFGFKHLDEQASSVRQTKDGGFIIVGSCMILDSTNSYNFYSAGFLLKTNAKGDLQWVKRYSPRTYFSDHLAYNTGYLTRVEPLANNGYIAFGGAEYGTPWLVKTDSLGNIVWQKQFQVPSGYKIYGGSNAFTLTNDRAYAFAYGCPYGSVIVKTDSLGNVKWSKNYGTVTQADANDNYFYGKPISSLLQTSDSGYIVTTVTTSDIKIVKTDKKGNSGDCANNISIPSVSFPVLVDTSPFVVGSGGSSKFIDLVAQITFPFTDSLGCFPPAIKADFSPLVNCFSDSTDFSNLSNGVLWKWDFGDPASGSNNTSNLSNPIHKFSKLGTSYTVTLIAKDENGNSPDTMRKILQIPSDKFIIVTPDITICSGDSTLISARIDTSVTFGYGIITGWRSTNSLRDTTDPVTYAFPTLTTTYIAGGSNGNCTTYDSLHVKVLPKPTLSITGNTTICEGKATLLSASGGVSYLWSNGNTASSIEIQPAISSDYNVSTSNGACSVSKTVSVSVIPTYTVNIGTNLTIIAGESVTLNSTGGGTLSWLPEEGLDCYSCPTPLASPVKTTTYYLTSKNSLGCSNTDSITLTVLTCTDLFVANAFSPNKDNVNDILYVKNECVKELDFKIFDRWGNMVFESNTISEGWDGTSNGKAMNPGIFVYYVNASFLSGESVSKKGTVCLMK